MQYLIRLDLDRIRRNLDATGSKLHDIEDVHRLLATIQVRRHDEQWFIGDEACLRGFEDGEVLEKQPAPDPDHLTRSPTQG